MTAELLARFAFAVPVRLHRAPLTTGGLNAVLSGTFFV